MGAGASTALEAQLPEEYVVDDTITALQLFQKFSGSEVDGTLDEASLKALLEAAEVEMPEVEGVADPKEWFKQLFTYIDTNEDEFNPGGIIMSVLNKKMKMEIHSTWKKKCLQDGLCPADYFIPGAGKIRKLLLTGGLALIKDSYFKDCLEKDELFKKRQEIPKEFIYDPKDALQLWKTYKESFFVALSYAWSTPDHPDAKKYTTPRLVAICEKMKQCHVAEGKDLPGCGLMVDFCSMYQNPRTKAQAKLFGEALGGMNCIYGHAFVTCIIMNTVPEGVKPYNTRAWPFFERTVSNGKRSAYDKILVVDDNFDAEAFASLPADASTFQGLSQCELQPPLNPMIFDEEVSKMNITNGGDMPLLQKIYKKNFAVLAETDTLNFSYAGNWATAETRKLSALLPFFKNVKNIIMHKTGVDDDAIAVLGPNIVEKPNWGEGHSRVDLLVLSGNPDISDELQDDIKESCEGIGTDTWFGEPGMSDEDLERWFKGKMKAINQDWEDRLKQTIAEEGEAGEVRGEAALYTYCSSLAKEFIGSADGMTEEEMLKIYLDAFPDYAVADDLVLLEELGEEEAAMYREKNKESLNFVQMLADQDDEWSDVEG